MPGDRTARRIRRETHVSICRHPSRRRSKQQVSRVSAKKTVCRTQGTTGLGTDGGAFPEQTGRESDDSGRGS